MVNVDLKGKSVFVTGAAGFIGSNLVLRLFKGISMMLMALEYLHSSCLASVVLEMYF